MKHELLVDYEQRTGTSQIDPLTGVYNHAVFQILFAQEIERHKRYGKSFALLLIDMDWFSIFNHRYGPIDGDRALQLVSKTIQTYTRSVDIVARYWGDCFSIILPESSDSIAVDVAERIQSALSGQFNPPVTVSVGIAICPDDGGERTTLFDSASAALHQAKKLGKARIHIRKRVDPETETDPPTILIVDDNPMNLKLVKGILQIGGYTILSANSGREALHACRKFDIDLILLDVMMPEMDGFETCRRLKSHEHTRLIPVILITALNDAESKLNGIEVGADDFISRPPNKAELLARTRSLINVKQLNRNLTSVENVLFSMARAVEAKDEYTQGHIERVATLAVSIGRVLRLSEKKIKSLYYGGLLHDIGKIGIPDEILNKPGPLNDDEWSIMQQHPEIGYKICMPLGDTLGHALDIIRYHHEKLDGSGYPYGLMGGDIPIVAQIMAIADFYDALVTDRPYRKGMPWERAIDIILQESAGGKLSKEIANTMITLIKSSIHHPVATGGGYAGEARGQ